LGGGDATMWFSKALKKIDSEWRSGRHFGETSVFEGVRRTATVRARTRGELLSIGQQEATAMTSVSVNSAG
jgi:CRP-like cAMP-binding protein